MWFINYINQLIFNVNTTNEKGVYVFAGIFIIVIALMIIALIISHFINNKNELNNLHQSRHDLTNLQNKYNPHIDASKAETLKKSLVQLENQMEEIAALKQNNQKLLIEQEELLKSKISFIKQEINNIEPNPPLNKPKLFNQNLSNSSSNSNIDQQNPNSNEDILNKNTIIYPKHAERTADALSDNNLNDEHLNKTDEIVNIDDNFIINQDEEHLVSKNDINDEIPSEPQEVDGLHEEDSIIEDLYTEEPENEDYDEVDTEIEDADNDYGWLNDLGEQDDHTKTNHDATEEIILNDEDLI